MKSERLYYKDPYIKSFSAKIVRQVIDGEDTYVVLDQTAFYPTGGGQPFDTGVLNDVKVTGVEKVEEEIRHFIEMSLDPSSDVIGKIDWERRFDHMQQHCGQHILSAAFEELFDIETVGFHLGSETVTIDLHTEEMNQDVLDQVEKRANEVVVSNLPIEIKWVTNDDLNKYPIRKKPTVTENIRLVIIPDFDYNGCGGTHPRGTAEVGLIKTFGWERNRGNIRLQFACGNRAIKELHKKQVVLGELTSLLRTSEVDAPSKLKQFLESHAEQGKELELLKEQLLEYEIRKIASEFKQLGAYKLIAANFNGRSIKELQQMARKIADTEELGIILFITEDNSRIQMVFAAGKKVEVKMNEYLKIALEMIDGKGGGKPDFAQGGGNASISSEELLKKVISLIEAN